MKQTDIRESDIRGKRKSKKKKRKTWLIVLLVILAVILLLLIGALIFLQSYYNKSNFMKDSDVKVTEGVDTDSTGLSDEEAASLQQEAIAAVENIDLPDTNDVYNLLLIGVDRRDTSWYGNSDSMILVSINKDQKKLHMTSFMRDLYADIPDKGVHKLNAANAYGGGPLLVKTIENNYRIHIDNYASVDFNAMIDIVDLVGGITLELSDAEANSANESIQEMCDLAGIDPAAHYFSGGGTVDMDGYQAVAYARIRNVGNSDYQRTERQREVIEKIIGKAKTLSIGDLNTLVNTMLPKVTHNVEESSMLSLLAQAPTILGYEVVQSRVPYDDLYYFQGETLVPDFGATIERLQTDIYGQTTVQ